MPTAQPTPETATPGHANGFNAEHAHAILRGLMEAGAELVQCLVEQARKDPVPHPYWGDKAPVDHPTEHIARCYDRITRSVRRSIALARYLDQPLRCQPGPARPSVEPRAPKPAPAAEHAPELRETFERPDAPDWNPDWIEDHTEDLSRPLGEVLDELEADLAPGQIAASSPPEPVLVRGAGPHPPHPRPSGPVGTPARPAPTTHHSPTRRPPG